MNKLYSPRYDAYYDDEADTWLDTKCDDAACEYCSNRPAKPSEVTDHDFEDPAHQ